MILSNNYYTYNYNKIMTNILESIAPELFLNAGLNQIGTQEDPFYRSKEICDVLGIKNCCSTISNKSLRDKN